MPARFSNVTLIPHNEDERLKFKAFRNEDVFSMYFVVSITQAVELVLLAAAVIYSWSTSADVEFDWINFVQQLLMTVLFWGVWALGRRFIGQYERMIAFSFAIIQLLIALHLDSLHEHHEDPGFVIIYLIAGYLAVFLLLLAPSIHFVLFYLGVYVIQILYVVFRYYEGGSSFVGFGAQVAITFTMSWYLLHKRELKRFYQKEDAEKKEVKAMNKEVEVTNVLSLQQNAVIIFSEQEETVVGAEVSQTPVIEFTNIKSAELFSIDLDALNTRTCLSLPQFVPLKKTVAQVYDSDSNGHHWELDALRVQLNNERLNSSSNLLSLDDIMLNPNAAELNSNNICEAYIMLDGSIDDKEDHESRYSDSTLIVRRASLQFNNKSCVVLSFEDISAVKRLRQEEQKSKMMSTLYSMVHHEMIGPLKSNEEAAVRLVRKLKDNELRKQAQIILICSKQVLLHATDLLDQKLLQNGGFRPAYASGSVYHSLLEIIKIASLTIQNRDIKVQVDLSQLRRGYPVLSFDKRRMQQVLHNLLTNAVKFTRKGKILIEGSVKPKDDDPNFLVLAVSVRDEGIGMSDEDASRVFDGLVGVRNATNQRLNPYGNGIGLVFCKQVCQSLDGDISVQSLLGRGSAFTFTMRMFEVQSFTKGEKQQSDENGEDQSGMIIIKSNELAYNASHDELDWQDLAELPPGEEEQCVCFQNANFIFKISRSTPLEVQRGDYLPHFTNLVKFLKKLEKFDLLEEINRDAKVVYADDQFVNQHTVAKNFEEIGIADKLITFSNGQDVIEYLEGVLNQVKIEELAARARPYQPVALLLLDINMPILDGFETLKQAKQLFQQVNEKLAPDAQSESASLVIRPMICFFSQLERERFIHFFTDSEQPEFFLEKPVAQEELASLLRLIKLL